MITREDPIAALAQRILRDLKRRRVQPHQKLQSERKLAELFSSTPNRVHRALQHLLRQGIVYTKPGSGTFIADRGAGRTPGQGDAALNPHAPGAPRSAARAAAPLTTSGAALPTFGHLDAIVPAQDMHTMSVAIPVGEEVGQHRAWQAAVDRFNREYPFIHVALSFDLARKPDAHYDVIFMTPSQLLQHAGIFRALERLNHRQIHPALAAAGCSGGATLALPIVRTVTVYYVHKPTFERLGLAADAPRQPIDLFALGAEIERRTDGRINGLYYWGLPFHAANAGIYFEAGPDGVTFDRDRLSAFLEGIRPHLDAGRLGRDRRFDPARLQRGQYAIHPSVFQHDFVADAADTVDLLRLPLADDGFMLNGLFLAGISARSPHASEARFFLDYLLRPETQRLITGAHPSYLSVLDDVLAEQKSASPYPPGAITYDFDPRSISYQLDLTLFLDFPMQLATQAQKYLLGVQSLKETLDRLEAPASGSLLTPARA